MALKMQFWLIILSGSLRLLLAALTEFPGEGAGECQPDDTTSLLQVSPASVADRTSSLASSREAAKQSSLASIEGASKSSVKAAPKQKASAKTHTQVHSHGKADTHARTLSHGKAKGCRPPYCWDNQAREPESPASTPHSEKECQDFCGWRTNVNLCIWSCKKALAKGLEGAWASSWSDPYDFGNIAKSWVRRADPIQTWFPSRGGVPKQMGGRWPKVAKGGNDWFDVRPEAAMKNAEKLAKFGLLQEEGKEGVKEHDQGA